MTQPTLEQSGEQLVAWFTQTAQAGTDFVIDQAPAYVDELLAWEFWSNSIVAVLSGALVAFVLVVAVKAYKAHNKSSEFDAIELVIVGLIGVLVLLLPALLFIDAGSSALKAKLAPRVVIVEHVRSISP